MPNLWVASAVVLAVAVLAFFMRGRGSRPGASPADAGTGSSAGSEGQATVAPPVPEHAKVEGAKAEADGPGEDDAGGGDFEEESRSLRLVAETAWGEAFLDSGERVLVAHAAGQGDGASALDLSGLAAGSSTQEWLPGGLRAARLRPGSTSDDPTTLEALGPDGDYWSWEFATLEAARAALRLLNDRSVVMPPDEDAGEPAIREEEFEAARRELEAIHAEALAAAEAAAASPEGAAGAEHSQAVTLTPTPSAADTPRTGAMSVPGATGPEATGQASAVPAAEAPPALDPEAEADDLPSLALQDWILDRVAELIRATPEPFLCAPLVTPSDRCFPDRWTPDERGASFMVRRLMAYARVPFREVRLEVVRDAQDGEGDDAAGPVAGDRGAVAAFGDRGDGVFVFAVRDSLLADSTQLAGALAHEVAHAWRVAKGLAGETLAVEEPLTDLTCVHLGFGVLVANGSCLDPSRGERTGMIATTRWSHERVGCLETRDLCFALAVQAVACGLTPRGIRRWLDPTQEASFAVAFEELKDAQAELSERLGLPPRDGWPAAWEHPSIAHTGAA